MKLEYTIQSTDTYSNIQDLAKNYFKISDRLFLKLKKNGKVFLNNTCMDGRYISPTKTPLHINDIITIYLDFIEDSDNVVPTKMDLDIIYEDDYLLVINKPSNCPTHPSRSHYSDTLSNGVRYYFNSINLHKKIRPINRLDADTTGLIIFAKNEYIQECLINQMKSKTFIKKYLALICGELSPKDGTINLPIARKDGSIIERCIDSKGDTAITHYKTLQTFYLDNTDTISNNDTKLLISLIECKLETGRTHQIRVHFSHIGHPLLGDTLYGSASSYISHQALHSYYLECIHPITHKRILFKSDDIYNIFNFIPKK